MDAIGAMLALEQPEDEVDPERLERVNPDFVALLREGHQHVYGPEYWKTYVRQLKQLWFTPVHYTAEDLARVTAPALVLLGDRDELIPLSEAVGLYDLLPKAELAVGPGSDHAFVISKADLFVTLVLDFPLRHRDATGG